MPFPKEDVTPPVTKMYFADDIKLKEISKGPYPIEALLPERRLVHRGRPEGGKNPRAKVGYLRFLQTRPSKLFRF